ncbi:TetR/AcrR family transcriptional regulator [Streptomonospora nanhaiensis]|uniref:TetR/AcrR family transcriptional regulator n=1 Tax=Streptomonospora nanhaiensis TaxID=1323731 RepID=UPI001C389BFE|nr:TetR/AcrR family transcriptional regulator [Streptomonospora nanhaiensis]MBV2363082.1 TetR/AcrR family transcriptional regulator [Streptomonospora nanhaiensis]MBX9390092.1 TetR/AcrR family transcriptional regulator [Streptomonospora nanhaiensis]
MERIEPARSTAEARRAAVIERAVAVFARNGYHATPVADVAAAAGISQAYVFRLFDGKLGLFTAALEHCYARIADALRKGADKAGGGSPAEVLEAMGDAYADLIADRDLLMMQVHAQSVADIPEVLAAMRRGYAAVVSLTYTLSGANRDQVQHFMAMGQLCHLIAALDLDSVDATWARTLTKGMRHVPTPPRSTRASGQGDT